MVINFSPYTFDPPQGHIFWLLLEEHSVRDHAGWFTHVLCSPYSMIRNPNPSLTGRGAEPRALLINSWGLLQARLYPEPVPPSFSSVSKQAIHGAMRSLQQAPQQASSLRVQRTHLLNDISNSKIFLSEVSCLAQWGIVVIAGGLWRIGHIGTWKTEKCHQSLEVIAQELMLG